MTAIMAYEIKARMERTGFKVSEIHIGTIAHSADGILAEMIVTDPNGQRFNIAVYQTYDEE